MNVKNVMAQMEEVFGKPIHTYTRAEALEDGVLVDVSEIAGQNGFKIPVAMTRTVWEGFVVPLGESAKRNGQSEAGRARDVLTMLFLAIRGAKRNGVPTDKLYFHVLFDMGDVADGGKAKLIHLKAVIGPGDNGEPVVTVMLPEED